MNSNNLLIIVIERYQDQGQDQNQKEKEVKLYVKINEILILKKRYITK